MTNYPLQYKTVTLLEVVHGDTIVINGNHKTFNRNFLTNDFFGLSYEGIQHRNGVQIVLYPKFFKGEFVGYFTQK